MNRPTFDRFNLPVTPASNDGGDSAVRAGLINCFSTLHNIPSHKYLDAYYRPMRHPAQFPWNNPKNFTKDQMKCFYAGMAMQYEYTSMKKSITRVLEENKRFGIYFSPSSERDFNGTTKYPYPHKVRDFNKLDEDGLEIVFKKEEWRMFDFADPLLPNDIYFLNKCLNSRYEDKIGHWFHVQSIKTHANSNHYEENQIICECLVLGTLDLYVKYNPNWKEKSYKYWSDRNELYYHDIICQYFQTVGLD